MVNDDLREDMAVSDIGELDRGYCSMPLTQRYTAAARLRDRVVTSPSRVGENRTITE